MDTLELANQIAGPIGSLGAAYYFCDQANVRAGLEGTNTGFLYAAGRGGVLGDVTPEVVDETFFFFKPGMITSLVEGGRATLSPAAAASALNEVAAAYGTATFADVDEGTLRGFSSAAAAVLGAAPRGQWPLVDGHVDLSVPTSAGGEAYHWVVILRELRGALHTDAVKEAGLSAAVACQLDGSEITFGLHGFTDDDRVPTTPELVELREAAELDTSARMAALLEVLDDAQRDDLAEGVAAMAAATAADSAAT